MERVKDHRDDPNGLTQKTQIAAAAAALDLAQTIVKQMHKKEEQVEFVHAISLLIEYIREKFFGEREEARGRAETVLVDPALKQDLKYNDISFVEELVKILAEESPRIDEGASQERVPPAEKADGTSALETGAMGLAAVGGASLGVEALAMQFAGNIPLEALDVIHAVGSHSLLAAGLVGLGAILVSAVQTGVEMADQGQSLPHALDLAKFHIDTDYGVRQQIAPDYQQQQRLEQAVEATSTAEQTPSGPVANS